MKHIISSLLLAITIIFFISSCTKDVEIPGPSAPVEPLIYNPELQSSKDISFASLVITDLDMMMAFLAGNQKIYSSFYLQNTNYGSNTATIVTNYRENTLIMSYFNTKCKDGRTRSGSVTLNYGHDGSSNPLANPDATNYHQFGFAGKISLTDYTVDAWEIELFDPNKPAYFLNKLSSSNYDPAQTNLTWQIIGKFRIINSADTSRSMVWEGNITKELLNTSDPAVFAADKQYSVDWTKAKVQYTGNVTGRHGSHKFQYNISGDSPLQRNGDCSFVPTGSVNVTQFHPFISGTSTFTISKFHPRTINYGPVPLCDNSGSVSFADETQTVNFD